MLPRAIADLRSHPPTPTAMPEPREPAAPRSFRATLIRVMAVQALTLLVLWFLQARYHG